MNKLLEIFFRYILPERIRWKYYLKDMQALDKRYPYRGKLTSEMSQHILDLWNDTIEYWRISV